MVPSRTTSLMTALVGVWWLLASSGAAAPQTFDRDFGAIDEITRWATETFFGGSTTQTFSRGGKDLVVVNGRPTSGLLTSQLVFFGRNGTSRRYRMILSTGVFHLDARATEDPRGIVVAADGTILLVVPFDIVDAQTALALPKPAAQPGLNSTSASPVGVETCRATGVDVTVTTSAVRIRAGTRPEFSVSLSNISRGPIRVLDVRDGRRNDLQEAYFQLVIVKGGRVVDLPTVISDPGPISSADSLELKPGERLDVRSLSYKRMAERLVAGEYAAVVLYWRDPEGVSRRTSLCRSSEAQFVVID